MNDRYDGCLILGLCFCGCLIVTLFCFATIIGDPAGHPPAQQVNHAKTGAVVLCLGSWVVMAGVALAEAIHDHFRRPRR